MILSEFGPSLFVEKTKQTRTELLLIYRHRGVPDGS